MRFEESTVPLSAEGHADGLTVTGFRSPAPSLLSSLPFSYCFPGRKDGFFLVAQSSDFSSLPLNPSRGTGWWPWTRGN